MKTSAFSLLASAGVLVGFPFALIGQTTWDFGATPDINWSSFTNWSTDATPAGTAVVFGATGVTANATTVGNIVDTDFTGGNALTSLTYNANSASWQVTQIAGVKTLTVDGAFLVGGLTVNSQVTKAAFTGTGSLVINNSSAAVTIANTGGTAVRSTLDMSALSTFTATVSSFNVGTGTTGYGTVYLANTSTITATSINSGGTGSGYGGATSNQIYLGTTTTLNANTLALAGGRTYGTVKFRASGDGAANNTTVSGATLKIRAADGTSAAAMTVGAWSGAFPASGTSSLDLTGGTVDAKVTTLKVGTTSANNNSNTASAVLTIDGSASSFDASGLVTVGETTGSGSNGTLNGILNVKGGAAFTAGSDLKLGNQTGGAIATKGTLSVSDAGTKVDVAGNIVMGARSGTAAVTATVNVSGGTLTVGGNLSEGAGGASITSTVNLGGGTLDLTRGAIAVDAFNFTGGTLKDVAVFTGSLNVQNDATLSSTLDAGFVALSLTGDLTLGANANLGLGLANDFTPVGPFTLVDNDGADSISGTFMTINGAGFGPGNTFSLTNNTGTYNFILSYAGGDGNDLVAQLTMIPEASTAALIAGVLTLGVAVGCRRRSVWFS
jgi:hypothetical protein